MLELICKDSVVSLHADAVPAVLATFPVESPLKYSVLHFHRRSNLTRYADSRKDTIRNSQEHRQTFGPMSAFDSECVVAKLASQPRPASSSDGKHSI